MAWSLSSALSSALSNIPPITKLGCALVTLLSALAMSLGQTATYFQLVPGRAMWCFWTLVTANLVEVDVFSFVVNLFAFLLCGKYLERVWGSREFLKFCFLTGCLSMFSVFVFFVCLFAFIDDMSYLFSVKGNGLAGVLCGFTVAFKHLVPEHKVEIMKGALGFRVKHFPLIYLWILTILDILRGRATQIILMTAGLFIGWIYIRFVKVQDGIRGDRSETFSFASFFPDALQPPVKVVSNVTFNLMVLLRVLRPIPTTAGAPFDLEGGLSMRPHVRQPLPGSDNSEAERRRALALRQLDIRLATSTPPSSAAPVSATPKSPSTKKKSTLSPVNKESPPTRTVVDGSSKENLKDGILNKDENDTG